jgi:vacuolar-type H+-ATPase subunit I/STV1
LVANLKETLNKLGFEKIEEERRRRDEETRHAIMMEMRKRDQKATEETSLQEETFVAEIHAEEDELFYEDEEISVNSDV